MSIGSIEADHIKMIEAREEARERAQSRVDSPGRYHHFIDKGSTESMDFYKPHVQGKMITYTMAKYCGILSLSRNYRNMLMWAHYGDSHTGFVLGLDESHPFFKCSGDSALDPALKKVTYRQNRHTVTDMMEETLFCDKSIDWGYEEEERVFKLLTLGEKRDELCPLGYDICVFEIPIEAIKSIYFGANMESSKKEAAILQISKHLPGIKLYRASLDQQEYALNFEGINPTG